MNQSHCRQQLIAASMTLLLGWSAFAVAGQFGPLLEQDLAKAIEKGWVRSVTIPGPPPDPKPVA